MWFRSPAGDGQPDHRVPGEWPVAAEFRQSHTHDVRINEIERYDATDETGTATVSVDVDIFERFQAQGGNVIGSLQARLPDCGTKISEYDEAWWQPAAEDEWP